MTQGAGPKDIFSTHDAARICRVTPMTVIRWIKEGKLSAFRTAGGHRRILQSDLARFCAVRGIPFGEADRAEAGRVLVADADPAVREVVADAVRTVDPRLSIEMAGDAFSAGRLLAEVRPGLLFLDQRLHGVDALELTARLARDAEEPIAVVVLLGTRSPDAERAYKGRGALGCVPKPPAAAELARLVRQAFHIGEGPRANLLYIVDKDARAARALRRDLELRLPGCRVAVFDSAVELLLALGNEAPDGIVVDVAAIELSAIDVVRGIAHRPGAPPTPVIAVGNGRNDGLAATFTGAGAKAFLTRPCGADAVVATLNGTGAAGRRPPRR